MAHVLKTLVELGAERLQTKGRPTRVRLAKFGVEEITSPTTNGYWHRSGSDQFPLWNWASVLRQPQVDL